MSIVDKVIAAVTPPESEEARMKAREKARAAAGPGDWLAMVLDHHRQIESAFAQVRQAADAAGRTKALKDLATLLTGHSMAEEAALYPALARANETGHATKAYTEQSAAKLQLGLLEDLAPMSQEFTDKLEHIRGAVAHHVYEEEGNWFLDLKNSEQVDQAKLTLRYKEQFERYMGKAPRPETLGASPAGSSAVSQNGQIKATERPRG
jgi:hemerythrin superfamily protein